MSEEDFNKTLNLIQQEQHGNESEMTEDLIETRSTQSYDEYPSESYYYELDDIINFSSPTTYYEYPQETKNFETELGEDYLIFNENLNDGDYDYMIDDHSIS